MPSFRTARVRRVYFSTCVMLLGNVCHYLYFIQLVYFLLQIFVNFSLNTDVLWFVSCYSVFYMNLLQIPCRSQEKIEFTFVLLLFFFCLFCGQPFESFFLTISTFARDCFLFVCFSLLISLKSGS